MIFKKLLWVIKRHPFLYRTRFKLLAQNVSIAEIDDCSYNQSNNAADIPSLFFDVNKKIFKGENPVTDLEKAVKISNWLTENIKGGPGLSEPSDKALRMMLNGDGGVCSDLAQIFNNFCVINNIMVREWGTTRIPFSIGRGGHSFNEIFSTELNQWILIDVYYGCLFLSPENNPLSVVSLFSTIRANNKVNVQSFRNVRVDDHNCIYYNYLVPSTTPFLICDYSNKLYDKFLKYSRPFIPVFLSHFTLYLIGKSYHYKFPLDDYKQLFS